LSSKYFGFELTWWRLFKKRAVWIKMSDSLNIFSFCIHTSIYFHFLNHFKIRYYLHHLKEASGPSLSRSYGSWIYKYLCKMLWVRIRIRARCTTLCDKICQWQLSGFLRVLRFSSPLKLTATI
jgi:hypothetical protein